MNNQDFIRQSDGLDSKSRYSKSIWRTIHTDPPLLVGIGLLCGFGLFVLFSATGGDVPVVRRQALIMVAGFVVMFIVAQFNVHFFRQWAPTLYAAGLGLLGLVLVIGAEKNGAKSWLDSGTGCTNYYSERYRYGDYGYHVGYLRCTTSGHTLAYRYSWVYRIAARISGVVYISGSGASEEQDSNLLQSLSGPDWSRL